MFNTKQKQKGVALYLTLVILSVLTVALLALIGISISQIKVIRTLSDSVVAFCAADTGIEHSLYNVFKEAGTGEVSGLLNEASYSVSAGDGTFTSVGEYKNTERAIEISF